MSIISTIYFSSKDVELLFDLKDDQEVLMADMSSRGINQPALLDVELDFILPQNFSRYIEKHLYKGKENELIKLTEKFIFDCSELTQEDILNANRKMNDYFKSLSRKFKFGIDNVSRGIRVLTALLLGIALSLYINFNYLLISILFTLFAVTVFFISFKKQKAKREKRLEFIQLDFVPQLKELVKMCKESKSKNLSAYYYWSL